VPPEDMRSSTADLVADLVARYRAGEVVVKVDDAKPWVICGISRASWYRRMNEGAIPGVLALGRTRRLQLGALLKFVGALPDDGCNGHCAGHE
jgi:hypothetical protein